VSPEPRGVQGFGVTSEKTGTSIHRKGAKGAKIKGSLTEITEGAEDKILFVCPEDLPGQTKRLFWRIGLSPILQKWFHLRDLCVSSESLPFEDERAVRNKKRLTD
jgi:hypothetical protein